ncbi:LLM class flavin-dependent oxidoreductase [Cytobacillus sp. IB215665]|uniref:LLM class flavin-dependent oxidoreductase n=1 Tax=Cytobacillus sp. IB215665 TaxID=3097357 RepID=UPI002A17A9A0|nr:LLM class flavin-dependent oxidoreductase [Cytobacillus sp. IB215665]MDX8365450.1 LLM class flavin-dependent oxidoreductase [Cytobacillus sp. IB215665]
MVRLSVLDQSPVPEGVTPVEAINQTVKLAQITEKLGYHRYWVAEHHSSTNLVSSTPEVLISHIAAKTSKIRVGSGGVMLPHYSSYKVAENFRMLEALYPNRIDLGVGRAPGGHSLSTMALTGGDTKKFHQYPNQIQELVGYLHEVEEYKLHPGLIATPEISTAPELWMLGSSGGSAKLAAELGASYTFAHFINGNGGQGVVRQYQDNFKRSPVNQQPHTSVAVFVTCAETIEEAESINKSIDLAALLLEKGESKRGVPSIQQAQEYNYTEMDYMRMKENRKRMIVGNPIQVKEQLESLKESYNADEIMIVTITHDFDARVRSYELIADAFGNTN